MKKRSRLTYVRVVMLMACFMLSGMAMAQTSMDGFDATTNTFNPNIALDSLKASHKEVPKGMYVWTIDEKFGDVVPASAPVYEHNIHYWQV